MTTEDIYYAFKELKEDILQMLLNEGQIADEYYEGDKEESNEDITDMVGTINDMLAIVSGHEDEIENSEWEETEGEEVTIKKKG
jgi:hypothetical protein